MAKSGAEEKKQREPRFDQKQYEMLLQCSKKKNMTEWNEWRKSNPDEDVLLDGADLSGRYLERIYLNTGEFEDETGAKRDFTGEVHLEGARMKRCDLRGARLRGSCLNRAKLGRANLEGADLYDAKLRGARLGQVRLDRANIEGADIRGTSFWHASLKAAKFDAALVDGFTLLWGCEIDRWTNFVGVDLRSTRIRPGLRLQLEYNIRRMNWEDWYWGNSDHRVFKKLQTRRETLVRACRVVGRLALTSPVRLFWSISDYGLRTWRIMAWFLGLAFVFALAYWAKASLVMVNGVVGDIRGFVHALYFSVVTMTTLGFGDIAANPDSWQGQVLLMLQVILGYVLLGALVTRFAVLFTAGGPAGKFSKETRCSRHERQDKE